MVLIDVDCNRLPCNWNFVYAGEMPLEEELTDARSDVQLQPLIARRRLLVEFQSRIHAAATVLAGKLLKYNIRGILNLRTADD